MNVRNAGEFHAKKENERCKHQFQLGAVSVR